MINRESKQYSSKKLNQFKNTSPTAKKRSDGHSIKSQKISCNKENKLCNNIAPHLLNSDKKRTLYAKSRFNSTPSKVEFIPETPLKEIPKGKAAFSKKISSFAYKSGNADINKKDMSKETSRNGKTIVENHDTTKTTLSFTTGRELNESTDSPDVYNASTESESNDDCQVIQDDESDEEIISKTENIHLKRKKNSRRILDSDTEDSDNNHEPGHANKSIIEKNDSLSKHPKRNKLCITIDSDSDSNSDHNYQYSKNKPSSSRGSRIVDDDDEETDDDEVNIHKPNRKNQASYMSVSDDDNDSVTDENIIQKLREMYPSIDQESLNATLIASEYDINTAIAILDEGKSKKKEKKKSKEHKVNSRRNKSKKEVIELESDDDFDNGCNDTEESSMSDSEGEEYYEHERIQLDDKQVLQFFQKSSAALLQRLPTCSGKRVQILQSLRPFTSYRDLVQKLENTKGVSVQLLDSYGELIEGLSTIDLVVQRCQKVSQKMFAKCENLKNDPSIVENPEVITHNGETFNLKSYQLLGVNWMYLLYKSKVGGILADEMGLGKTIQALCFLKKVMYMSNDPGPHLIVVPPSTADNWVREAKKWCMGIRIIKMFGTEDVREEAKWAITSDENTLVITTYNVCVGKNDAKFFSKCKFHCVIFDEGHMLKNMSTNRYKSLIKIRSQQKILLTGTPLQNNLVELMSLLYFVIPEVFGDHQSEVNSLFAGLVYSSKGSKKEQEKLEEELDLIQRAQVLMKPFLLRRLKTDVLFALPKKTEDFVTCKMSNTQKILYSEIVSSVKSEGFLKDQKLGNVLMQLRKAANHPLLHRKRFTLQILRAMAKALMTHMEYEDNNEQFIFEDMEVMTDFELHNLCLKWRALQPYCLSTEVLLDSGKFEYLRTILPNIRKEGDRVLLFSQFTMMLDVLELFLNDMEYRYLRLDGQTAVSDRQKLLDEYYKDDDIFIFLASTKAGGVGLNITAANVVILHDIDFNPHNDAQATARVHRMGQKKDVKIIKLVSENSVEEVISSRATAKLELEGQMTEATSENEMSDILKAALNLDP